MFRARYFSARYFESRYFSPLVDKIISPAVLDAHFVIIAPVTTNYVTIVIGSPLVVHVVLLDTVVSAGGVLFKSLLVPYPVYRAPWISLQRFGKKG